MSNEQVDALDVRLTETRNEFSEEHVRLWEGLEDEKVSRIAGDEANKVFTTQVEESLSGTERRLSTEVIHREIGDLNNIGSLTALSQAMSDYRIKTDLEIAREKVAREQLGIEWNAQLEVAVNYFDHEKYLIYQSIQEVQLDVDGKYSSMDNRIKKYEDMLQDITMDSIQITMDNGEINMGAWTILSQAREWDLEILRSINTFKGETNQSIEDALADMQNQLPNLEQVINDALEALSESPIVKELDRQLNEQHKITLEQQIALAKQAEDRVRELAQATDVWNASLTQKAVDIENKLLDEANARIDGITRESLIRAEQIASEASERADELALEAQSRKEALDKEAADRTAEIEAKFGIYDGEVSGRIDEILGNVDTIASELEAEEAKRIEDIRLLNDGLTLEIGNRKQGDVNVLSEITAYKVSNESALSAIRNEITVGVSATQANATKIDSLDVRLTSNEKETGVAKSTAASALSKASSAVDGNSALSMRVDALSASITELGEGAETNVDVYAFNMLKAEVTSQGGVINTNVSDVSTLKSSMASLESELDGNVQAVAEMKVVQTKQGDSVTQLISDSSVLKNDLSTVKNGLGTKVESVAFNETKALVEEHDDTLKSVTQSISTLGSTLNTVQGDLSTKATVGSVDAVNNTITQTKKDLTAVSDRLSTLNTGVNNLKDNVATKLDATVIQNYYTKAETNDVASTTAAGQITQFKASIDGVIDANTKAISSTNTEVSRINGEVIAHSKDLLSLSSAIADTNTTLTNSYSTKSELNTAISNQTTSFTASINAVEDQVNTKADSSVLASTNAEVSRINGEVLSHADQLLSLRTSVGNTNADLANNYTTKASMNEAMAEQATTLTASIKNDLGINLWSAKQATVVHEQGASEVTVIDPDGISFKYVPKTFDGYTSNSTYFHSLFKDVAAPITVGEEFQVTLEFKSNRNLIVDFLYTSLANNTGPSYLRRIPVTTEWQTIVVPITAINDYKTGTQQIMGFRVLGTDGWVADDFIEVRDLKAIRLKGDSQVLADLTEANADAIQSINTSVERIDGAINTQSNSITSLNSRVDNINGQLGTKADSTALANLSSRVSAEEGKTVVQAEDLVSLRASYDSVKDTLAVKAEASALQTTNATVSRINDEVVAQTQSLLNLDSKVNDNHSTLVNNYYTKTQADESTSGHISQFKAGINLGGKNLLNDYNMRGLPNAWRDNGGGLSVVDDLTYGKAIQTVVGAGIIHQAVPVESGMTYTYSMRIKSSLPFYNSNLVPLHWWASKKGGQNDRDLFTEIVSSKPVWSKLLEANVWHTISVTILFKNGCELFTPFLYQGMYGATVQVAYAQFEKGDFNTDWHQSDADLSRKMDTKASAIALEATNSEVRRVNGETVSNANRIGSLEANVKGQGDSLAKVITLADATANKAEANAITSTNLQAALNDYKDANDRAVASVRSTSDATANLTSAHTTQLNTLKSSTDILGANLEDAEYLARMLAAASLLTTDPTFKDGFGSVGVYNNTYNGAVTVQRVARTPGNPVISGFELLVTLGGGNTTPGLGGFLQNYFATANSVFIHKAIMKFPMDYTVHTAANDLGPGGSTRVYGNNKGTGRFETYYIVTRCGEPRDDTTVFNTFGFFWFDGPKGTDIDPIKVNLAYLGMYDATSGATDSLLGSFIADASSQLNTLTNGMSSNAQEVTQLKAIQGRRRTYRVVSNSNGNASIGYIDNVDTNKRVVTGGRSYTLVVFDAKGDIRGSWNYDVYGNGAAGPTPQQFNDAVASMAMGEYAVVFTSDEPKVNSELIKASLISLGASGATIDSFQHHYSYILIGRKGLGEGQGIELRSVGTADPVEYMLDMVNGVPLGLSGNATLSTAIRGLTANINTVDGKVTSTANDVLHLNTRVGNTETNIINNYFTKNQIDTALATQATSLTASIKNDLAGNLWSLNPATWVNEEGTGTYVVIDAESMEFTMSPKTFSDGSCSNYFSNIWKDVTKPPQVGEVLTVTYEIKATKNITADIVYFIAASDQGKDYAYRHPLTTDWVKKSVSLTVTSTNVGGIRNIVGFRLLASDGWAADDIIHVRNMKLVRSTGDTQYILEELKGLSTVTKNTTASVDELNGKILTQASDITTLKSESINTATALSKTEKRVTLHIDMTGDQWNENYWYPVGLRLWDAYTATYLKVSTGLWGPGLYNKPSWASHEMGYQASIEWSSNGHAWGAAPIQRTIDVCSATFVGDGRHVCQGIGQIGAMSTEVIYLRGGGYYQANVKDGVTLYMPDASTGVVSVEGSSASGFGDYNPDRVPVRQADKIEKQAVSLVQTNQVIDGVKAVSTISVDNNGFMSGYGLISQLVNGIVTSAFGVDADYFYVGKSMSNAKKPFMVLNSPQNIGGISYPAGVWMDVAVIANATIGSAHIGSLNADVINAGTLSANRIAVNSLSGDKLVFNSITADKLAVDSVTADKIVGGTITSDKIQVNELSALTTNIGLLRTATSGARTEIQNNLITVYDSSNRPRVKIGVF